jgi:hypothetical protein
VTRYERCVKILGNLKEHFGRKAGYWSADCDFLEVMSNETLFS